MRLEVGMLIKTNYSGPYRIKAITRGCRCPLYLDTLASRTPPEQPEHLHLTVTNPDGSGRFWLNHYVEETLRSLQKSYYGHENPPDFDYIVVLPDDQPVQLSML